MTERSKTAFVIGPITHPHGPPMTLGNMRELGVQRLERDMLEPLTQQ